MKLVLSSILARFDLALANTPSVHHRRRGLVSGPSPFRMTAKRVSS
jgi:cytochrome P450